MEVVLGGAVGGRAVGGGGNNLEIGEEAPLEVVAGATLVLAGERERTVWVIVAKMDVSSYGRGRGVVSWLQFVHL